MQKIGLCAFGSRVPKFFQSFVILAFSTISFGRDIVCHTAGFVVCATHHLCKCAGRVSHM